MGFFQETAQKLRFFGWHLILHLDAQDLVELEPVFRKLPVPFVIDHMGRVKAADGLEQQPFRILLAALKNEKCWVKICGAERVSSKGPPFDDAVPFGRALVEAAPDRVLWGTDWPHPNVRWLPDDAALVDLLPLMAADQDVQRKILVDNPARLYGFGI
jgi:predicted TIM-barrel fold metal-dependent hydrolase